MPTASRNVRVRGQSRRHVLILSSSQFDPISGHRLISPTDDRWQKSFPYPLTEPRDFDILLCAVPASGGSDAIRSTYSARVHHAYRRRHSPTATLPEEVTMQANLMKMGFGLLYSLATAVVFLVLFSGSSAVAAGE